MDVTWTVAQKDMHTKYVRNVYPRNSYIFVTI
jgi:hypothetical protein